MLTKEQLGQIIYGPLGLQPTADELSILAVVLEENSLQDVTEALYHALRDPFWAPRLSAEMFTKHFRNILVNSRQSKIAVTSREKSKAREIARLIRNKEKSR